MTDTIFSKVSHALGYHPSLCVVYTPNPDGTCGCNNPTCRAKKHSNPSARLFHVPAHGDRYGILCGESGLVVIDIDVKDPNKNGATSYAASCARLGAPPTTLTVQTPSGGWHVYFKRPAGLVARDSHSVYGPGIDVKGSNNSLVIAGVGYRVVTDAPIAELPAAWANAIAVIHNERESLTIQAVCDYANDPELLEWARERFRKICRAKPGAVEGRGGEGDMFPWQLGLEARRLGLPPEESFPIVVSIWNPKCEPPWETEGPHAHDAQRGIAWVQRKIEGAWRGADVDCIGARFLRFAEEGFPAACERIAAARNEPVHASPAQERVVMATLDATSALPLYAPKTTRRELDPDHVYSWVLPSLASSQGKKTKIGQVALQVLFSSDVWAGVWQYNEFADEIRAVNPPMPLDAEERGFSNVDVTSLLLWLESTGRTCSREAITEAVEWSARQHSFHPVREYLGALQAPDAATARHLLREVLARECFGVETDLECTYVERTLIAAVRRVFSPGCEVHSMLVLVGTQDRFKSRALKALFGGASKGGAEWFKDQMPKLEGRDASHALHGKWGIEFSELGSIVRSDNATVKEFLSRAVDEYRQFGNKQKITLRRQCVFLGTTNDDEFLRDETGNRRYWPIQIRGAIDLARIIAMRDLFWAAAKALADEGLPHWMTSDETAVAEQSKLVFVVKDPWEADVEQTIARLKMNPESKIMPTTVLNNMTLDRAERMKLNRGHLVRVGAIMRALGWRNTVVRSGIGTMRVWVKMPE